MNPEYFNRNKKVRNETALQCYHICILFTTRHLKIPCLCCCAHGKCWTFFITKHSWIVIFHSICFISMYWFERGECYPYRSGMIVEGICPTIFLLTCALPQIFKDGRILRKRKLGKMSKWLFSFFMCLFRLTYIGITSTLFSFSYILVEYFLLMCSLSSSKQVSSSNASFSLLFSSLLVRHIRAQQRRLVSVWIFVHIDFQ